MRIYEINTRAHCQGFDQISDAELSELRGLGFDAVWLMGVWQISEGARKLSKVVSEDFEGSPYAIPDYKFNRALGGKSRFCALVRRAHRAGLRVIVDFVSNHMAVDSPWIDENPEFFVRSDLRARKQAIAEYFLHPSGEVIAYGRDPYFPPWLDTSQLDYTSPELRARMTETLKWISHEADGVRCDMAMLVLRDYIRRQWHPLAPESWFDQRMPGEFWDEAIRSVKAERPDFTFIAEAYWDKEPHLWSLGFDLAYEKRLYDGLASRDARLVSERIARSGAALTRSVYFIENHDEPRAVSTFSRQTHLAALALILSIPGSVLIHEGQMEGKRERLPVQRIKPLAEETPDLSLKEAYARLLKTTDDSIFRNGAFHIFDNGAQGVVSFFRQDSERVVAYLGQVGESWQNFNFATLDLSPLARALGLGDRLRVTNLLTSRSTVVEERNGAFRLLPNQLSAEEETSFCLIEASPE